MKNEGLGGSACDFFKRVCCSPFCVCVFRPGSSHPFYGCGDWVKASVPASFLSKVSIQNFYFTGFYFLPRCGSFSLLSVSIQQKSSFRSNCAFHSSREIFFFPSYARRSSNGKRIRWSFPHQACFVKSPSATCPLEAAVRLLVVGLSPCHSIKINAPSSELKERYLLCYGMA